MTGLRFLESMDTVRSAWNQDDSRRADDAYKQSFLEALVSLAFDLDIVAQQSCVFDSYSFQRMLVDLDSAYARVRADSKTFWNARPMPVRIHLFGGDSFMESVASNLRRMAAGSPRPFKSSLYPELPELGEKRLDRIADDFVKHGRSVDFARAIGSEREEMFDVVLRWFGTASIGDRRRVVTPNPGPNSVALDRAIEAFLAEASGLLSDEDHQSQPASSVITASAQAIRALQDEFHKRGGVGSPFAERSRLHSDSPWTPGGPNAVEVLGSHNTLRLVREIIDTLYNRVVVQSIGVASASYTTTLGKGRQIEDELAVQTLALQAFERARGSVEGLAARPDDGPEDEASLAVRVPDPGVSEQLNQRLGGDQATRCFEAILRARQDREWTKSFIRLDRAARLGSKQLLDEGFDLHLELLARTLEGRCQVERTVGNGVRFVLKSAAAGWATKVTDGAIAEIDWSFSGAVPTLAFSAAELYRRRSRTTSVRELKASLGQFAAPIHPL